MKKTLLSNSYLTILALIIFSFNLVSCNDFEGSQETPAYINIKGFKMVENPDIVQSSKDGFQTEAIKDAWVYVDNVYIGTYSLPCKVPILEQGKHKIDIRPGVKLNGIAMTRTEYPFYTYYSDTIDLVVGKAVDVDTISIMYKKSLTTFAITELFEDPYISFSTVGLTQDSTKLVKCNNQDIVQWGSYCGAMYLNSDQSTYKIITDSLYCNNYSALIMEIDYWCNIPFGIGMAGRTSSSAQLQYINAMTLNANDTKGWQKVYVVLGKVWSQLSYPNYFQIYLTPQKKDGVTNGWVYIDNIKIIHKPNS
jgi:hypothetical protein